MAPIKPSTQKIVSNGAPPPVTPELGKALVAEQNALKTLEGLKKELAAANAAFKANPSDPKLATKLRALLEKTKAAHGKWESAKGTADAAVSTFAGGGKAADQAQRLSQKLPVLKKELETAKQFLSALTPQLKKAVADAQAAMASKSPQLDQLMKKANDLQARANKLEAKSDELSATIAGLESGLETRQGTVIGESKAAKKVGASEVIDVVDLASRSVDEQVRLGGAPITTVSSEKAAEADVARIQQAMKVSPENGAKMLAMQLRGSDPRQQSRLINLAGPQIATLVKEAQTNPKLAAALLDTLKEAHGMGRSELAKKLVEGITSPNAPMLIAATSRLDKGDGTVEAQALTSAMWTKQRALSAPLSSLLTQKVTAVQEAFVEKAKGVQKLNGDLARLVVGFGPMMSPAQKNAAVEAFKGRHKEEYAAWEAAGAKLAPMMQYAIESGSERLQSLIPEFLATKAGEQAVMEGLAAQQEGQPGLLDALTKASANGADAIKIAGAVSTTLTKGVGLRAIQLARDGRMGEAEKLIGTLKTNARLFGVEPKAMEGVTAKMADVLKSGGQKAAVDGLTQEFKNLDTNAPGFAGRSAQALKGLGVAFSAVSVIDNLSKFDELALKDQIKTVADGIGTGIDGGLLAMEIVGKANPASKLVHLTKRASAVAGAVGAVMDGISAVDSFRKGEHAEGVAQSAAAVGGAILATYAFAAAAGVQALPVAGQVIGAVLVIGGTIAKWTIEERKAAKKEKGIEDDAQAFLEAAGVDPKRADELSDLRRDDGRNVGMVVKDLAPLLGMTPKALFDHLLSLTPAQIDAFVDHTKDVAVDRDGRFRTTGDHGLSVTAHWMQEDGLLNGKDGKLLSGVKMPPLK